MLNSDLEKEKRKKKFFRENFYFYDPIFFRRPTFEGMKHVTHKSAQVSTSYTWYQIVRWAKGYNSSHIKRLRADKLKSGGLFSEKKATKLRLLVAKNFQNFLKTFSEFSCLDFFIFTTRVDNISSFYLASAFGTSSPIYSIALLKMNWNPSKWS